MFDYRALLEIQLLVDFFRVVQFLITARKTYSLLSCLPLCAEKSHIWGFPVHRLFYIWSLYMSRLMTKPTKWPVRPAKTQISLGIRPVTCFLHAARTLIRLGGCPGSDQPWHPPSHMLSSCNEDSDQTGRMPRLIWVFDGRTCLFFVLSWGGSYILARNKDGIWS